MGAGRYVWIQNNVLNATCTTNDMCRPDNHMHITEVYVYSYDRAPPLSSPLSSPLSPPLQIPALTNPGDVEEEEEDAEVPPRTVSRACASGRRRCTAGCLDCTPRLPCRRRVPKSRKRGRAGAGPMKMKKRWTTKSERQGCHLTVYTGIRSLDSGRRHGSSARH